MNNFYLTNSVFGLKHILILVACIAIIVLSTILLRNKKLDTKLKILLFIGIISESIKVIYYIITNEASVATQVWNEELEVFEDVLYNGYLPKTDLPFHLCSLQLILIFILNLSKNENLKRLLYSFMVPTCLVGGSLALILATSSSLNGSFILSIQYFGFHSGIIWFSINILMNKEIDLNIKDYFKCLIMLFEIFFFAIYLNSALADYEHNINFMYVVNPPMNNLPFLTKKYGWGVYIAHYVLTALFAVTLCYIKPIINALKKKEN